MQESTLRDQSRQRHAFDASARMLLDAIDTIALVLDQTGRVVLANQACEALLGIPADEMVGRTLVELGFAPREPCAEQAKGVVQVRTQAGETRQVTWSSRALFEPDGSMRCVVVTASDVSAAGAGERRVRESERRFRELAENVNDLVAELTLDARFAYVNPRFEAVLGFPPEHVLGQSAFDYVHPADVELAREAMASLNLPGVSRQTTLRVRRRAGGFLTLESVARTFVAPDEQLRLAVVARDVSARTAAETELRRVDRLLTLGTFAAGVGHEIKNPVAAILLAAEVALERPRDAATDPHMLRTLERIAEHARRCGAIVRSMLEFAARGRSERRLHDVNDLVTRALSLVDGYARERGASLRFSPRGELPRVQVNGVEIEQVLVNLLRNALESGPTAAVAVETRAREGTIEISVSDDGEGISELARPQIFDSFYSTKHASGGLGLGLAIVRRIVVDHGGQVRLADRALAGTCFVVELPAARPLR
ncbi:MAG TPA: PAS domain S-box protein [Myxococcota bacterium]|nr:PAS domain S-box protein [Myxococcota bacterium]